jgi:hypothetical protein
MVVAIAEAVKRSPQHPLWLVETATPRDEALLEFRDCQVCTIPRVATLGSISNTKTMPAGADRFPAIEHYNSPGFLGLNLEAHDIAPPALVTDGRNHVTRFSVAADGCATSPGGFP